MKFLKIFALLGVAAWLLIFYSFYSSEGKTGHVELQKIFQSFEGKLELEKRMKQSQWNTKIYLDSLNLQLTQLIQLTESRKTDKKLIAEIKAKEMQISNIKEKTYQIQGKQSEDYTQQIWDQINQYIKDFGAAQNYDYIFGTEGSGMLMYGKNEKNLTDEVLHYINQRYQGE